MSVVIDYRDAGPCRKQLTIEVPAPAVDAELGRVERELIKTVRIRGFRRGKVPASLVRQRFRDEIDQRVKERLVPRYWRQAQAEKSLDPLLPPEISELKLEAGSPMTFVAEVEVRPEITLDLDQPFDLPAGDVEPTDAEIEEALDDLRRHHATWRPVDRPAARGDRVIGAIRRQGADGDTEEEPQRLEVEVGGERVWEELTLALTGLSAGQTGEFTRPAADGEGEPQRFRVEVEAVEERELPELDDDFAARLGDFEDVAALRRAVAESLRQRKREELDEKRRQALLAELRRRHPLELPQRLIDREAENMMTEYASHLARQGVDVQSFDWQALGEQLRPGAEQRVHDRLLLDAAADQLGVEVDEKAFEGLLRSIAAQQQKSPLVLRQELAESGRLESLRARLRRERTLRRLLGEDQDADEPQPAEAAAEP